VALHVAYVGSSSQQSLVVTIVWIAWQPCNALKLVSHEIALVLTIEGTLKKLFNFFGSITYSSPFKKTYSLYPKINVAMVFVLDFLKFH
jgi:hypothetical protein